ncbi:glutamyl-Q tRNA(Asp) synthetase [Sphingomonas cannabina]|uniref:glutamyl-Q tRNA(Asp) synthetase n=1 Tax=Sphingomonas cannabina TaxID=2899123 RepID=UPI001F334762|nr:glutamyl-Q tRNA(Asp) synthetase [Sphingomonas cannabina]UIJ47330.1 glutamyl-Q tRNA(Asp) synthetase [Sphingomonas cannabina]
MEAVSLPTRPTTRFAPSPTGRLHLGHAFSALQAHDFARERNGTFLLRIEDIDGTRSREEFVEAILEDLAWLGLRWDGPVVRQSERLDLYEAALDRLRDMGLLYPCFCTRADIAASVSAPHGPEGPVYPGTCRNADNAHRLHEPHCWRLDVGKAIKLLPGTGRGSSGSNAPRAFEDRPGDDPTRYSAEGGGGGGPAASDSGAEGPLHQAAARLGPPPRAGEELYWHDDFAGWVRADPLAHGDVVLARKDAPASYHLAVTVDDAAQGVTHVVRGRDLFAATDVHRLLQALLDLPTPAYRHHALLTDAAGRRLAKRHGTPTLADLRERGLDGPELAAMLREGRLPLGFATAKA